MVEYIAKTTSKPAAIVKNYQTGTWVSVVAPDKAELADLAKQFELDETTLHDVLDSDEIPRLEHIGGYDYIFVRFAVKTGQYNITTKPLLIVMNEKFVLTIAPEKPRFYDDLVTTDSKFRTTDASELAAHFLKHLFEEYSLGIKQISHRIKRATTHLREHKLERDDFVDFVLIEDDLSNILSALTPMPPVLQRLIASDETVTLDAKQTQKIDDIQLSIEQSVQSCNSNMRRIVSVREAYSTISNNSLNRTMKTLTMLTLLVALPNVVFGMYGMNILLPVQSEPFAYPVVIGSTLVLVLIVWVIARVKRVI